MPLAYLTGLADAGHVAGLEWMQSVPRLPFDQLVYVGLRDIDLHERAFLRENGVTAFTMHHIDKYGIGRVMDMALETLGRGRPLHLSYDIDACDPLIAPHTGTAVRGGLTYREAHFVAEAIAETNMLGSMDLVEVNPQIVESSGGGDGGIVMGEAAAAAAKTDQQQQEEGGLLPTVELGLALIASALGNRML